jgi:hypothetical protein
MRNTSIELANPSSKCIVSRNQRHMPSSTLSWQHKESFSSYSGAPHKD